VTRECKRGDCGEKGNQSSLCREEGRKNKGVTYIQFIGGSKKEGEEIDGGKESGFKKETNIHQRKMRWKKEEEELKSRNGDR